MFLLLLACAPAEPETERQLSIVGDTAGDSAGDSGGDSDADSGGDSGADSGGDTGGDDDNYTQGMLCGDGDATDDPSGADVVVAEWCTRVTPEGAFDDAAPDTGGADTGAVDTASLHTGAPQPPPPPPCGFVNLVGSVDGSGDPSAPLVLYCDSDADGGTRAVRHVPGEGLRSTLLSAGDCTSEPASAALLPVSDGWLALWATSTSLRDGSASGGVMGARVDADGVPLGPAELVEGEIAAWKLAVVPGDPALLLLLATDGALWSVAVRDDGGRFGGPMVVAEGARSVTTARVGEEVWVATCAEAAPLTLTRLDAEGARVGAAGLAGSGCGWMAAPQLVAGGDGAALVWDDGERGWLALFGPDGAERGRVDLGAGAYYPAVTWTGAAFATLDATGALSGWDPDGEALGTAWFAGVVDAPGSIAGLRLAPAAGALSFLVLGLDSYTLTSGHVNSFNYLEAGALPAPGFVRGG